MAASPRLGAFHAKQVWSWIMLALGGTLFFSFTVIAVQFRSEYRDFLRIETKRALETHRESFIEGNFRASVEMLTSRIQSPQVSIQSSYGPFKIGSLSLGSICHEMSYEGSLLSICGNPRISSNALLILFSGLASLSLGCYLMLQRQEKSTGARIRSVFEAIGLPDPLGGGVAPLVLSIGDLKETLTQSQRREGVLSQKAVVAEMAHRVAHDIRSPLTALKMLADSPKDLASSEGQDLFRMATDRILGIANDLSQEANSTEEQVDAHDSHGVDLARLVEQAVREKKMELQISDGVQIELKLPDAPCFLSIAAADFLRTLSNLLNNSFEAVSSRDGQIKIGLIEAESHVSLEVEDNGKGIPPPILERLRHGALSHDKPGGSGIGLSAARKFMDGIGGTLSIHSEIGRGTLVSLIFPRVANC